jgi:acyl carrier protein
MNNTEKLVQAFVNAFGINKELVIDNLQYRSIEQWDSISHMILISELEEAFKISIDAEEVIAMNSVEKAKQILSKYNVRF